jgi:hypothetical protein
MERNRAVSTQEALLIQQGDHGKELLTKLAPHDPGSTLTDTRDIIPLSSISSMTRPVLPTSSRRVDGVVALSAVRKFESVCIGGIKEYAKQASHHREQSRAHC